MSPIDSHNRNIKDREKHIMSNALFKETSFKLNQPIYQWGNWNTCCWEIRCLSIKIQPAVSTKMRAHLYARVWAQKSIKIVLRAKFRVFAYVWVCMSCKPEHAWCHRRCFPRLFPFGLLSVEAWSWELPGELFGPRFQSPELHSRKSCPWMFGTGRDPQEGIPWTCHAGVSALPSKLRHSPLRTVKLKWCLQKTMLVWDTI